MVRDDVLACSIATTGVGRRSTGDLSTTTEEASERLYRARDAPPFWRTDCHGAGVGLASFVLMREKAEQMKA